MWYMYSCLDKNTTQESVPQENLLFFEKEDGETQLGEPYYAVATYGQPVAYDVLNANHMKFFNILCEE